MSSFPEWKSNKPTQSSSHSSCACILSKLKNFSSFLLGLMSLSFGQGGMYQDSRQLVFPHPACISQTILLQLNATVESHLLQLLLHFIWISKPVLSLDQSWVKMLLFYLGHLVIFLIAYVFSSCSVLKCILAHQEDGDIFWINDVCEIRIQPFLILSLLWQHTVDTLSSARKKAILVSFSSMFCKMSKQHWIRARVRLVAGSQPAFWMGVWWDRFCKLL